MYINSESAKFLEIFFFFFWHKNSLLTLIEAKINRLAEFFASFTLAVHIYIGL